VIKQAQDSHQTYNNTIRLISLMRTKEREVAELVGREGICEIPALAEKLVVSPKTIENYKDRIKQKARLVFGRNLSWVELVRQFTLYYHKLI
jgi:FixJ family two-component response regulator